MRRLGNCAFCARPIGETIWAGIALPRLGMVRVHTHDCLAAMWRMAHGSVPDVMKDAA